MNSSTLIDPLRPERRIVWRISAAALLVCLIVLVAATALVLHALGVAPIEISLNGERLVEPRALAQLSWGSWAAVVGGLTIALLALVVVVPVALLVAVAAAALVLLLGLGLPLLIAAFVLAVVMSPLALIAWLLWRALRPSRTIAA
jgi:hypothetical protein